MCALFRKQPKLHSCFFCSELVPDDMTAKHDHYRSHLIEVTDNNGQRAYTFSCPRCGVMDQAWGGGRPNPSFNAVAAIAVHMMEAHHDHSMV